MNIQHGYIFNRKDIINMNTNSTDRTILNMETSSIGRTIFNAVTSKHTGLYNMDSTWTNLQKTGQYLTWTHLQ